MRGMNRNDATAQRERNGDTAKGAKDAKRMRGSHAEAQRAQRVWECLTRSDSS